MGNASGGIAGCWRGEACRAIVPPAQEDRRLGRGGRVLRLLGDRREVKFVGGMLYILVSCTGDGCFVLLFQRFVLVMATVGDGWAC
jgi:hypothetical protein